MCGPEPPNGRRFSKPRPTRLALTGADHCSELSLNLIVWVDRRPVIRSGGKMEAWVEHHVGNHDPKHGVMLSNSLQGIGRTND